MTDDKTLNDPEVIESEPVAKTQDDDVQKVLKALDAERRLNKAAQGELSDLKQSVADMKTSNDRWSSLDIDFDEVRKLINKSAPQDTQAILDRERKEQGRLKAKFEKDLMEKQSVLDEKIKYIETMRKETAIKAGAEKAGILSQCLNDVVQLTKSRVTIDENDKLVVLDNDGYPTSSTVQEFFEKDYKEAHGHYYLNNAQGSGLKTAQKVVAGKYGPKSKMTPEEKSKFVAEFGAAALFNLK